MKTSAPELKILDGIRKKKGPALRREHQLECTTGAWLDSAVLKLQKRSWTQTGADEGVFFSVWVGERDLKKQRFNYNIHALGLRFWKSHAIKPREFATAFREKFRPSKKWPNLSLDYGPQTLMQGWQKLDPETFEDDVLKLTDHFVSIHPIIDRLLEERKAKSKK